MELIMLTIIFVVAITLLAFIPKRREQKILIPIAFVFVSIIIFVVSLFIGGWEGMGIGVISLSLFAASITAIFLIFIMHFSSSEDFR